MYKEWLRMRDKYEGATKWLNYILASFIGSKHSFSKLETTEYATNHKEKQYASDHYNCL